VTAPINKEALKAGGINYPGHTEIFQELTHSGGVCMMLTSDEITVSMVTTHIGLMQVGDHLSPDRVTEVIRLTAEALGRMRGRPARLAVCGLNPHAGEHGLFGRGEEERIIIPGIEQAKASGKYDAVLCRYSDSTKHYALTSRAEYFSENSEAYFGANDFYPFVRAELKEYDPKWYAALEDAWGVDREVQKRNTNALTRFIDSTDKPKSKKSSSRKSRGRYAPTKQYDQRQIEGWTVYVSKQLHKRMGYCQEMCKLLRHKLHLIKRYVPEAAVKELQKVPIWLELNDEHVRYMTYHSDAELLKKNEQNPDKLGAVEIGNVRNFRLWQDLQPSMVLHQLAYGYYDRVVGSDNARLKEIYQKAVDGGKYDSVLRFDGKHVRHPALTDVKEYFAEMSEARFGINDHYPFIRFELKQCDSEAHEVISALWKAEGEPATARKKE